MFSDTHCHLSHVEERGENLAALLSALGKEQFRFVFDIGTKPGDLEGRLEKIRRASNGSIPSFLHFSCGLWPDAEVIADRENAIRLLESDIKKMLDLSRSRTSVERTLPAPDGVASLPDGGTATGLSYAALGECGLDRFWNGRAAAERIAAAGSAKAVSDDGPGTTDIAGEEELFSMQLDLAKKYRLPVIVHSREAYDATFGCIKNGGWDTGVIHCYSYGIEEARAFLDRGWYISFPGNITWAKKEADKERIAAILRYIPRDRILLETDAPYLAPAPHRGKTNTPLLVSNTYAHAASTLGMETAALADLVFLNARDLFARKDPPSTI